VRITGGAWAKRRLLGPRADQAIRPTPDALREQAFAILAAELAGARFLDLFAGTGAVSLEALSRGATVVAVERDRRALDLIRRNLTLLEVENGRCELLPLAAAAAITTLARRGARFDAGWCDPPFAAWDDGVRDLERAAAAGLFIAGAPVVLELPPRRDLALAGFEVVRDLRGAVLLRARPPSHGDGPARFVVV